MPTAYIDNQKIEFSQGESILKATRKLGIEIPTMCYLDGYPHYTSCMVCMVDDTVNNKLLPACSSLLQEGMKISTNSEATIDARREAIELLLSDHVGDCEAPCRVVCPSYMDIPKMNRLIAAGRFDEALKCVKEDIALPEILGYICPAPCENICRRKPIDSAVSICMLKLFVAHENNQSENVYIPYINESTGKHIGIVGSGPTGLAAAYYLLKQGHKCTIYEKEKQSGGMLRFGALKNNLPEDVLDREIGIIQKMGLQIDCNVTVDKTKFAEMQQKHDAIVFAAGNIPQKELAEFGFKTTKLGIDVNQQTFETNIDGVFAGGNTLRKQRMAVKATGHGKEIAFSIGQYLHGSRVTSYPKRFNSKFGKLFETEYDAYKAEAQNNGSRNETERENGFTADDAIAEASRCMHCDCRDAVDCKLREYADKYNADQRKFSTSERKEITKNLQHSFVVYEPQKCIKCSLCIQITEKYHEKTGLTFIGRGFDVTVATPLNTSMEKALQKTAELCIEACPTGALCRINKV